MEVVSQGLDEILRNLGPLDVDWRDEVALTVIKRLRDLPVKENYTADDVKRMLDDNFDQGILICRLFLGLSKDQFESRFRESRGDEGVGAASYRRDPDAFVRALGAIQLLEHIAAEVNREPHWTDSLVERLRSGRGSAIVGQKRGRNLEDFVQIKVVAVFGEIFDRGCNFTGPNGTAKCDFAIPSKKAPRIVIESKGYGATGSKQTDVLGDAEKIVKAKRPDTAFLFFTDGLTWKQRQSDLKKVVAMQNRGDITRIYTSSMIEQFESDLRQLKGEYNI